MDGKSNLISKTNIQFQFSVGFVRLVAIAPVIFQPYPYPCFLFFTDGPGNPSTKVPSPRAGKSKLSLYGSLSRFSDETTD